MLSSSSGINGPGVAFEQVGTQLEVLPIVYGNGQIWLEINPQVRTVNQGLGITTVFGATPGILFPARSNRVVSAPALSCSV